MELLAKLFDRKLHPRLTAAQSGAYAVRVRAAASALQADIDAAAAPSANVTLLERVRTALGRIAQFELANLKRSYKIDGMSEAAIHDIIPDRPVAKKAAKKAEPPAPAPRTAAGRAQVDFSENVGVDDPRTANPPPFRDAGSGSQGGSAPDGDVRSPSRSRIGT